VHIDEHGWIVSQNMLKEQKQIKFKKNYTDRIFVVISNVDCQADNILTSDIKDQHQEKLENTDKFWNLSTTNTFYKLHDHKRKFRLIID